jgi:hypothetical protein
LNNQDFESSSKLNDSPNNNKEYWLVRLSNSRKNLQHFNHKQLVDNFPQYIVGITPLLDADHIPSTVFGEFDENDFQAEHRYAIWSFSGINDSEAKHCLGTFRQESPDAITHATNVENYGRSTALAMFFNNMMS